MNWHLPHYFHDDLDMLRARLKAIERALNEIIEVADDSEDAEEALIKIANLAEAALKL